MQSSPVVADLFCEYFDSAQERLIYAYKWEMQCESRGPCIYDIFSNQSTMVATRLLPDIEIMLHYFIVDRYIA